MRQLVLALIAAILLAVLWTGMESFGFGRQIHGWFLLLWLTFLPFIWRWRWKPALHVAMIGLLTWSFFCFEAFRHPLWVVQIYFLVYLALFILGLTMATYEELETLHAIAVQIRLRREAQAGTEPPGDPRGLT